MKDHERRIELLEKNQEKIEQTLDNQTDILKDLKDILERNTETLETHERRSTASEKRLDILEKKDIKYKSFVRGAVWVLGSIAVILSTLWVSLQVLEKLMK